METGHSTIFTMQGGKAVNCINRVVTKYLTSMPSLGIEVVERIIGSSIDYIFIQDNIPSIGRKITEVSEISYDFDKRTVSIKPIFKFNFEKELFERVDAISKDKAEMMLRRGVRMEEIKRWMYSPQKKEEKNVD
jgi:pilus assembly protein CpaF